MIPTILFFSSVGFLLSLTVWIAVSDGPRKIKGGNDE